MRSNTNQFLVGLQRNAVAKWGFPSLGGVVGVPAVGDATVSDRVGVLAISVSVSRYVPSNPTLRSGHNERTAGGQEVKKQISGQILIDA